VDLRGDTINVDIDIINLHDGGTTGVKFYLAAGQHYHVSATGIFLHNNHDGPRDHFHVNTTYANDTALDTRYGDNSGAATYPNRTAYRRRIGDDAK
jgi:hypothetical protein